GGRMNFPTLHHLCQSERRRQLIGQADVILGLELTDFWGTVNEFIDNAERSAARRIKPGTKLISIGVGDLYLKANYQDFERFAAVDLPIAGDAQATLPALIEAVKSAISAERRAALAARGNALRADYITMRERAQFAASHGFDASPVSTARVCAELYAAIRNEN